MRTNRKLQANVYGEYQTNSRKNTERVSKSRFKAQGIEAEMNVSFAEARQEKENP
jgi:hypothetical protein